MILVRVDRGRKLSVCWRGRSELGVKAAHRDVVESDGSYGPREPAEEYVLKFAAETQALSSQNTFFWSEIVEQATT